MFCHVSLQHNSLFKCYASSKYMINWLERHNKLTWAITIIIAIIIFIISSMSFGTIISLGQSASYNSFIYHFFSFFWLAFFLMLSIVRGKNHKLIFLAIILAIIYAVLDEIHQIFVPSRACTFLDVMIDSSGILLSSFLYLLTLRKN